MSRYLAFCKHVKRNPSFWHEVALCHRRRQRGCPEANTSKFCFGAGYCTQDAKCATTKEAAVRERFNSASANFSMSCVDEVGTKDNMTASRSSNFSVTVSIQV